MKAVVRVAPPGAARGTIVGDHTVVARTPVLFIYGSQQFLHAKGRSNLWYV